MTISKKKNKAKLHLLATSLVIVQIVAKQNIHFIETQNEKKMSLDILK